MELLVSGKPQQKFDPQKVFAVSKSADVKSWVALTLALAGRDAEAAHLADELAKERPQDTWYRASYIPAIRAQIELNHGNPAKAVELLKSAQAYDKGNAGMLRLRGNAFRMNHQFKEAETEFLAAMKLRAKARTTYQDFFVIWKDADADLLMLKAAKAEYGKLQ